MKSLVHGSSLLFHVYGVFQAGQGHFGLGGRLAQQRGDLVDDAHLFGDDLVGDLHRFVFALLQLLAVFSAWVMSFIRQMTMLLLGVAGEHLFHIFVVLGQIGLAELGDARQRKRR